MTDSFTLVIASLLYSEVEIKWIFVKVVIWLNEKELMM